jgi:hypothetical protein
MSKPDLILATEVCDILNVGLRVVSDLMHSKKLTAIYNSRPGTISFARFDRAEVEKLKKERSK